MPYELRKGRTSALLDGADLRYVAVDGIEVVRRIYVTVRDAAWDTIPVTALETAVRETPEAIVVEATGEQASGDVAVAWNATARLQADGIITYRVAASPLGDFAFNRIGLCVLHPPETCAGRAYRAARAGAAFDGTLPETIEPDHLAAFEELEIDVRGLGRSRLAFAGDLFEMEDQRNWSDGSFKTYCTPLARPLPQQARRGAAIEQSVELTVPSAGERSDAVERPATRAGRPGAGAVVELHVGGPTGCMVPELGLGLGAPLDAATADALRALAPAHLRVDLRAPDRFAAVFDQAASDAARLGCPLALALHLGDAPDDDLYRVANLLRRTAVPVASVLAFARDASTSTGPLVTHARERLGPLLPQATFAGGTDVWFVDLNRARPDRGAMDALAWSITPQVHGDDELTMIEALAAQTDQAVSARAFSGELRLLVGPVTLCPRYNPHAPDAAAQALDPPPSSVDPRQDTPFAAAWTAGSVAALAHGGVHAVTYFETVGVRGVVPAGACEPLPCGRVIGWATRWAGREVLATTSAASLRAQALLVREPGGALAGLVVNLAGSAQRVRLAPVDQPDLRAETLRGGARRVVARDGALELELDAWDVVNLRAPADR